MENLELFEEHYTKLPEPKPPRKYYFEMLPHCEWNPNRVRDSFFSNLSIEGTLL